MKARNAKRVVIALGAALALSCGGSDESAGVLEGGGGNTGGGTSTGATTSSGATASTGGSGATTSAGGSGARSGAGGTGARTSTGGHTGASCPPAPSGACATEGQLCEYAGSPCGEIATCTGGTWTTETVCPPQPDCPATLPAEGAPCPAPPTPVSGPLQCRFGSCPAGTLPGYQYEASCEFSAATWQVRELECIPAVDCGECPPGICCASSNACPAGSRVGRNQCPEGQLCVRMQTASEWYWDCAVDNCAPAALDCGCVGNACSQRLGAGWGCTQVDGPRITCECADCSP